MHPTVSFMAHVINLTARKKSWGSRCNLESPADGSNIMHIDVFVRPRLCHSPVLSVHHNEALSSSKRGGSGVKDCSTGREISCQPPHTSDPLINYFWGKER